MAELFEVLNTRSSIRAYTEEALTMDEIKKLIEAGLKAPTARNEQEVHISAVDTGNAIIREIQNALNPKAVNTFYYGAPVLFLLSGRDSFMWSTLDAGIAVENMHLAAKAMGLGSLIIGCIEGVMNGSDKEQFSQAVGIPEGYSFKIALAVGHQNTEKIPHEIDAEKNSNYVK